MSRGRILVVDDIEMNRDLLEQELEEEGFEVVTAADGPQAIAVIEQSEVDLVLLDIQMPVMSGLEVLEVVRRDWPINELGDNAWRGRTHRRRARFRRCFIVFRR